MKKHSGTNELCSVGAVYGGPSIKVCLAQTDGSVLQRESGGSPERGCAVLHCAQAGGETAASKSECLRNLQNGKLKQKQRAGVRGRAQKK